MQYLQQSRANLLHTSFGFTTGPHHPPPYSHHTTAPLSRWVLWWRLHQSGQTVSIFFFNVWSLRSNFRWGPLPKPLGGEENRNEQRKGWQLHFFFFMYVWKLHPLCFDSFYCSPFWNAFYFIYIFIYYSFLCLSVSVNALSLRGDALAGPRGWVHWLLRRRGHGGVADASAPGRRRRRWVGSGWVIRSAAGLLSLTLEQLQTHCLQEQLARMSGSRVENGAGAGSRGGAWERQTDRDSLSHCPPGRQWWLIHTSTPWPFFFFTGLA